MTVLDDTLAAIRPVDEQARRDAARHQQRLAKPLGALGRLEEVGIQLAAIAGTCPPPLPDPALLVVFAGDHGVQARGVSSWPQEVSLAMTSTMAAGRAGGTVLARSVAARVRVVDMGLAQPVEGTEDRRVAAGTRDMTAGPAMTREQALQAVETGIAIAREAADGGIRLLVPGEVGIGNTAVAAALVAAFTGAPAATVTGRGAGADDEHLRHKAAVVDEALQFHALDAEASRRDPLGALAAVGGFEHAAMVGLYLGAAERRLPVVLDGVIACSAALVAVALAPAVRDHLVAGHAGDEPGITTALAALGLEPLLDLGLRLGEGTGGVLAVPVVQAAARVLAEMATLDGAGVTTRDPA